MESSMLDMTGDVQQLTAFQAHSSEFVRQLKATQRPMTLTVDGRPELVVQDAAAYRRLLDIAASTSSEEGIRQGLDDVAHGRTRLAGEALDEFRQRHSIPR